MALTDAVIPARNEESTIGAIVRACVGAPSVGRVIVVDDGSTDGTAAKARSAGAIVVLGPGSGPRPGEARAAAITWRGPDSAPRPPGPAQPDGSGKGEAVTVGLRSVTTERVFFCDADYTGLTSAHVEAIAGYSDKRDWPGMVVAAFWGTTDNWGKPFPPGTAVVPRAVVRTRPAFDQEALRINRVGFNMVPRFSLRTAFTGFRALPVWLARDIGLTGYLVELQIEHVAALNGVRVREVPLAGIGRPIRRASDPGRDARAESWYQRIGVDIPIPVPPQREETR